MNDLFDDGAGFSEAPEQAPKVIAKNSRKAVENRMRKVDTVRLNA